MLQWLRVGPYQRNYKENYWVLVQYFQVTLVPHTLTRYLFLVCCSKIIVVSTAFVFVSHLISIHRFFFDVKISLFFHVYLLDDTDFEKAQNFYRSLSSCSSLFTMLVSPDQRLGAVRVYSNTFNYFTSN